MGRAGDSWSMTPPTKWGMKPSLCGSPGREKTGWPVGEIVVLVVALVDVLVLVLVIVLVWSAKASRFM